MERLLMLFNIQLCQTQQRDLINGFSSRCFLANWNCSRTLRLIRLGQCDAGWPTPPSFFRHDYSIMLSFALGWNLTKHTKPVPIAN